MSRLSPLRFLYTPGRDNATWGRSDRSVDTESNPHERLVRFLRTSERILIFTGAGVSTGSGIPEVPEDRALRCCQQRLSSGSPRNSRLEFGHS
jgi:hypothetical protein